MENNKKRMDILEDISTTVNSVENMFRDWKGDIDFDNLELNEKMMVDIARSIDKLSNVLYDMLEEQVNDSYEWLTLKEAVIQTEKGDLLIPDGEFQNIVCEGGINYRWERSGEYVLISGAHMKRKWRIVKGGAH